jgi:integrase/recombinase XerC
MEHTKNISSIINAWSSFLINQKQYSSSTVESYQRDLRQFFSFLLIYLEQDITQALLQNADIRLFRSFLASPNQTSNNKASIARTVSGLKNFYNFIDQNFQITNIAITHLTSPKKDKNLPKALNIKEIFEAIEQPSQDDKVKWVSLRDKAIMS